MTGARYDFEGLTITSALRVALRDELAEVITFDSPMGERWNPSAVARQTEELESIPGSISDDGIVRFTRGDTLHTIRREGLIAIAGFLLEFGFITPDDLDHFASADYSRVASALAQLHGINSETREVSIADQLLGAYRDYRLFGENRLLMTTIVLASPDQGRSMTVSERRTTYSVSEPAYLLDETENLHPALFYKVEELLDPIEDRVKANTSAHGAGVATDDIIYFLFAGIDKGACSVVTVDQVHAEKGTVCGIRARRKYRYVNIVDGEVIGKARGEMQRLMEGQTADLELYPQGFEVEEMPKFVDGDEVGQNATAEGTGFHFTSDAVAMTKARDELLQAARVFDSEVEAAMRACPTATEKLILALELFLADHALQAVADGADVNAEHPGLKLPVLHAAASLGMREVVRSMLAVDDCDVTKRDHRGRLASSCAGGIANDLLLRDELIAAQTKRFRDLGLTLGVRPCRTMAHTS